LGWKDLAENDIQVRIVPGNHGSITGEPFVRELVERLCEDLDAAQRVPSWRDAASKLNTELTTV